MPRSSFCPHSESPWLAPAPVSLRSGPWRERVRSQPHPGLLAGKGHPRPGRRMTQHLIISPLSFAMGTLYRLVKGWYFAITSTGDRD